MRHHVDELVPEQPHRASRAKIADGRVRGMMALQRTAGNRAVAQYLRSGDAVIPVQRCGSAGCADCGPKRDEDAKAQGVLDSPEDIVQRTADGSTPAVQRVATFTAGAVHEVNNLANCVINGGPAGLTWMSLNGSILSSEPTAKGAIVKPTVKSTVVVAGGFDAEIDTVPTNDGSFDETVLAAGPWRLNVPKASIAGRFPSITTCTGPGDTSFRAKGDPSDAAMFAANRRHEDHHAADHKTVYLSTIGAWDAKVTAAKAAGTKFHGATANDAEAALWAAMGGTPDQVAVAYMNGCLAAGRAFHGTPAGGPIAGPFNPTADGTCANVSASYTNPS